MEQKNFIRNISGTACLLSFALSTISANSTIPVNINDNYKIQIANHRYYDDKYLTNPFKIDVNNIYKTNSSTRLEKIANELFGEMRDATPEEQASINNYIKKISKDTGVNFFDIC